ncbi:hypothetical protein D3C71_1845980 [compost metagenome]
MFFEAEGIVEGCDRRHSVEADTACRRRELLAFRCADAADMGDQRHFALRLFRHDLQHLLALGEALYEGFAR